MLSFFFFLSLYNQSGYQAAGGSGVLCGRYPQQRTGCSGDHGQQTQQGTAETHERTEYSQTGNALIQRMEHFEHILPISTELG